MWKSKCDDVQAAKNCERIEKWKNVQGKKIFQKLKKIKCQH